MLNEYCIVECMFLNKGKVVILEKLSEFIFGSYDYILKNVIEVYFFLVWKKVRVCGVIFFIKSKWGFGYVVVEGDEVNM